MKLHQKYFGSHPLHSVRLEQIPFCTQYTTGTSRELQKSEFPDLC